MRKQNRLRSFLLNAIFLLALNGGQTWGANVPSSWYQLPEDGLSLEEQSPALETRETNAFLKSLKGLLTANAEALDQLNSGQAPGWNGGNPPPDAVDWRLYTLLTELGISAKGIMAPVSLKGTAFIGVFWRKKLPVPVPLPGPASETNLPDEREETPAVMLTSASDHDDLTRQIEPMIQLGLSTKKVKDEDNFRKNLKEAAETFWRLSQVLSNGEAQPWWVSRLRLDFSIDISGTVHPGVSMGGEFKLRFEWHRLMKKEGLLVRNTEMRDDELQKNFRKFVNDMAEDAHSVSYDTFHKTGFYPNYMKIGIGFSAKFTFGVVKFGGGLSGTMYISTVAKPPTPRRLARTAVPPPTGTIDYIEHNPSEQHLSYARSQGIAYEVTRQNRGLIQEVIYKIDRQAFRRGLTKAVQISSRFAEGAGDIQFGKWRIYEIRPGFELSIGGDFKAVSIAGSGSIEMAYYNGKF